MNRRQYMGAGIGIVAGGFALKGVSGSAIADDGDTTVFITDFSEYAS